MLSRSIFAYDPLSRVTQEAQAIAEGTAQGVKYSYDQAGNRLTLRLDEGNITAAYAYDSRDRCTGIDTNNGSAWVDLADYILDTPPRRQATLNRRAILLAASQGLGNAISRRDTTCNYPGNTKPKPVLDALNANLETS